MFYEQDQEEVDSRGVLKDISGNMRSLYMQYLKKYGKTAIFI
jgi:hypothetical protein